MISLITQLTRYEMAKGKEIEAIRAFEAMAKAVKENEPGCLMYAITRGQVHAQEIYFYEVYQDQAAFDAHRKTEHMQEFRKSIESLLDRGSFNVEILDEVAGYIRAPVEEMRQQM